MIICVVCWRLSWFKLIMSTLPLIVPHLLLRCVLIWMKSYMASLLLCHKKPVMNWPCLMLQTHLLYLLSLSPPSSNPTKPNFLLLPNNNKSTKDHLEQKRKGSPSSMLSLYGSPYKPFSFLWDSYQFFEENLPCHVSLQSSIYSPGQWWCP